MVPKFSFDALDADGDGEDVVHEQRCAGDLGWGFAEVVASDDVRAAAAWIGEDCLAV